MPKLTEFGKKLPKAQQEQALALADVADRLRSAGEGLYPGVPYQQWTPEMWDKIWTKAEEEWEEDERRRTKLDRLLTEWTRDVEEGG